MGMRNIIEIDEDRCTGCGLCITACAEGALALVDGKAKLISETYCDGLGACLSDCPEGAITIIQREADPFDEEAVKRHLEETAGEAAVHHHDEQSLACGCPGSLAMDLSKDSGASPGDMTVSKDIPSTLTHWPIKLKLAGPAAPFLKDREIVLLADCAAAAYPDLHRKVLNGRAVVMGCPKFDDPTDDLERLTAILTEAKPGALSVVYMEVPCCYGYLRLAREAVARTGNTVSLRAVMIGRGGEILKEEIVSDPAVGRVGMAR
jgi:ferredoxin